MKIENKNTREKNCKHEMAEPITSPDGIEGYICSHCGKDLTETGESNHFYLQTEIGPVHVNMDPNASKETFDAVNELAKKAFHMTSNKQSLEDKEIIINIKHDIIRETFGIVSPDQKITVADANMMMGILAKRLLPVATKVLDEKIEKQIEVFKWLLGYYDFPEPPAEGRPRYYWRSHLRDKLKEIGVEIPNPGSPFQPQEKGNLHE